MPFQVSDPARVTIGGCHLYESFRHRGSSVRVQIAKLFGRPHYVAQREKTSGKTEHVWAGATYS